MENPTIRIGGREIPLVMTSWELAVIQEEVGCTVGQLRDEVFGVTQNMDTGEYSFGIIEDGTKIKRFGKLLKVLGNAGLEEAGKEPDLTDKWILRNMKPAMIIVYAMAAYAVVNEGNLLEQTGSEKNGPVDEGLEEELAKKPQGN